MKQEQQNSSSPNHAAKGNSLILHTSITYLVYIILLLAFFLFWHGHNAPGGGFIAGLISAAAIILLYLTFGSQWLHTTLTFDFKYLVAIGLSISLACGLAAVLLGKPFLTHTFTVLSISVLGEIELATATIFDLGVYCVVSGGCVVAITAIGESDRAKRRHGQQQTTTSDTNTPASSEP